MRYILYAFFLPVGLFWGWYFLSLSDFGYVMFTRQMNELVFNVYGEILHLDPATLPPLIARACAFDGCLLLAIMAFRRRRELTAWYKAKTGRYSDTESRPSA